ncbi:hypothetical protein FRB93_005352 [Tulasnella sp. JGI-2019a]|nr:hypothetical protein FRB93_005352 [Tulasnella sp. JGI-2019a]
MPLETQLVTAQEAEYRNVRERLRERDLQIHSILVILLTISLAMDIPLLITAPDLRDIVITWTAHDFSTVVYSATYIYTHGCPSYVPGRSGTIFVVLWGVLGISWIYVLINTLTIYIDPYISISPPLQIIGVSFYSFCLIYVLSIGFGLYWRYHSDSKYIINRVPESRSSTLSSCGLQHILQLKQLVHYPPDSDSSHYIITHVGWWQERSFWKHQYVVVRALVPRPGDSSTRYFRVERHKTAWLSLWDANILDFISYSAVENDLTLKSTLVADFDVSDPEHAL